MARSDKTKGRLETLRRKEVRKAKLGTVKITGFVLVGASALTLGLATDAPSAEAHGVSCSGSVIAYEDGSWAGGVVIVNGRKHADAWTVVAPFDQGKVSLASNGQRVYGSAFPLAVNDRTCKTYIGRP